MKSSTPVARRPSERPLRARLGVQIGPPEEPTRPVWQVVALLYSFIALLALFVIGLAFFVALEVAGKVS